MKQRYSQRHNRFRTILREARRDAGLTQQQLAKRLKRSDTFVSDVEIGLRMLDTLEFLDYAKALGLDPRELIDKIR